MKSIEWAAGLFEGEGCISFAHHRTRGEHVYPTLVINMTDEEPIRWFAEAVGYSEIVKGPYLRHDRKNSKPFWYWRLSGAATLGVMALLFEHLGPRRQAKWLEIKNRYLAKDVSFTRRRPA